MPIIGAIKNGVKTKVAAKLPNLFPASRTTFDNTGTGLSSNRVQGAIAEVANRTRAVQFTTVVLDSETVYSNVSAWTVLLSYRAKYAHSIIIMSGVITVYTTMGSGLFDYYVGGGNVASSEDKNSIYTPTGNAILPINFTGENNALNAEYIVTLGMYDTITYRIGGADVRNWRVRITEIPLP